MVPIRQMLVSSDKYNIKCPYSMTPTRIVVHNTANDAPAGNEISYMRNNPYEISYHYAVDDTEIVQGIPTDRNAWHAGDGNGKGNREGIGIEICYSLSGDSKFDLAERNAAEFIASLLYERGWGIDKVTKHQDYDGKYCPHRTLNYGWQRFLDMVQERLTKIKGELTMAQYDELKALITDVNAKVDKLIQAEADRKSSGCPEWAKEIIQTAIDTGLVQGDGITAPTPDNVRPQDYITRAECVALVQRATE